MCDGHCSERVRGWSVLETAMRVRGWCVLETAMKELGVVCMCVGDCSEGVRGGVCWRLQ